MREAWLWPRSAAWLTGPTCWGFAGTRTAQQDVYDFMGQGRSVLYSGSLWDRLAGHSAYDDLDLTNDRFPRWHPLNQSLYVGYKVMLAGLLLLAKGDRVAMNSSVETRYPLLDDDVIAFCASIAPEYKLHGLTDKWLLRQVAARTLPARIANRKKTMFRASRSEAFLDQEPPALGRPAPEPRVAQGHRLVRSRGGGARAGRPGPLPADHAQADHHGPEPDLRDRHPALAPHLPGRRPVRAADVGRDGSAPGRIVERLIWPYQTMRRRCRRRPRPCDSGRSVNQHSAGAGSRDGSRLLSSRSRLRTIQAISINASHHDTP